MATAQEYDRLRRDIGSNATQLTDVQAEDIFVEAEETYTGVAVKPATRVIALTAKMGQASEEVSYKQNNSSEDLSDRFKNMEKLLRYWEGKLREALAKQETARTLDPVPSSVGKLYSRW